MHYYTTKLPHSHSLVATTGEQYKKNIPWQNFEVLAVINMLGKFNKTIKCIFLNAFTTPPSQGIDRNKKKEKKKKTLHIIDLI